MRKLYLLIGVCSLISVQALPQEGEIYASTDKQLSPDSSRVESYSLKAGLGKLEKQFDVSIAFKDEWVEKKMVRQPSGHFSTIEGALGELLSDTDLYYEKAGPGFYVISLKRLRKTGGGQSASLLKVPDLSDDFSSPARAGLLEDNALSATNPNKFNEFAIQVSGKVTDETGLAVPGVNVLIKGTALGTATDAEGRYSLSVPDESAVLVFTFIGYATQEIAVGSRTTIDVSLKQDVKALEEVVVTALGIEKSTRGLGYATTKVNADQLSVNRSTNLMNTSISPLSTGPAGTSKIRIRGQTSIAGQNNPLFVINGVPMDNTNFGSNPGNVGADNSNAIRSGGGNTSDGGDGLTSINPDDVESMTVLKGAAASALYGSRANNGVIMITTKSKGTNKGLGVTYNMNYTDEKPLDYTDYQYEYGQGENGVRPTSPNPTSGQWSFGEKIQPGMTQVLFDGLGSNAAVPYVAQKGIINQFYRHGQNLTNTVTLSTNSDKGGLNLSIANMDSKGIVPNNTYNRKTINLGFGYDLSEKLSFKGNINYSNEVNKNPPNVGEQDNTIPTALMAMANTMPLSVLSANKYNAGGGEFIYSRFTNRTNPYFVLSDQFQNIRRDRIFGNITVKYDILKWLFVQGRVGQDYWSRDQDYDNFPTGKASLNNGSIASGNAPGYLNGIYTQESRRFRETNMDFLLSGTKDLGDVGVNVNLGGNQMLRRADVNSVQVTDFIVKGLYTVQNGRLKDPLYDLQQRGVNSLYGSAEANYKKFIYLSGTLRNDWFSTLSPANRSILYSSVSGSYVFSESFTKPNWLSLGKFRAAYAQVGSDGDVGPYANLLFYGTGASQFGGQPVGNFGSTVPNANLRPMRTAETELGIELKMFDNRVGLDLATYRKITTDQIVTAQISDASGFTSERINSGKSQNQGIEMMLNIIPVRTSDFQWDFTFAGAYNITKVLSLLTNTAGENITVGNHVFNGSVQQIVGQQMGQIVGFGYRRDDGSVNPANKGQIVFGPNGLPLPTLKQIPFGSALPKWVGGFTNAFNYKGILLSFLIDFKLGGKVLSGTNFNAVRHGLQKVTLEGREGGVTGKGVDVNSNPNTAVAPVEMYWTFVRSSGLVEPVIYNSGYWKLRQITIGYDLTKFFPANSPIRGLRLNLVANNVLMLKKWVPNIDPDSFGYSSDNLVGMESPGVPTTRSIGFNLNVKF